MVVKKRRHNCDGVFSCLPFSSLTNSYSYHITEYLCAIIYYILKRNFIDVGLL